MIRIFCDNCEKEVKDTDRIKWEGALKFGRPLVSVEVMVGVDTDKDGMVTANAGALCPNCILQAVTHGVNRVRRAR